MSGPSVIPDAAAGGSPERAATGGAQSVVRRIIVLVILFALVVIAAIGLSGLLERAIGAGSELVASDAALARSLAFALIGAPLAGGLWWWERRRLAADAGERGSWVWALYVAAMYLTALVAATVSLGTAAVSALDGQWRPAALASGVVWLGVWVWHRYIRGSATTGPTRLTDVPVELAAVFGLIVAASGAVAAIAVVVSQALVGVSVPIAESPHWITSALQSLCWFALGAAVWWWHWFHDKAVDAADGFALVLLVVVVGAAAAATLFAVGTICFVVLRVLFDTDPLAGVLAALDVAVGAALIGGIVWVVHASVLDRRSRHAREAGRLVVSGVALIGAASGFGVIVNALLASLSDALTESDPQTLLLGGLSALAVGATAWWLAWRPARHLDAQEAAAPARRTYLVVVFGASAIVALVTLLVIGYRLFEFVLAAGEVGGLVERIRAPLGLLSATALVFAYHFAIWRRDRALAGRIAGRRAVGRVILITNGGHDDLAARLRSETGARVSTWQAADPGALTAGDVPAVVETLHGLSAPRAVVIADADGTARIIPLAD